ncbi:MAG TPA: SDR family oxidoreductase [Candidatus Baltobacteraceae bacterium]|jgi:NAD(P)-dependent dehydrogenase (short-subunit alcohol dehydrogenase family)|nr:SDR family oxidoreductase [Candidatus Baltobacteraceae bacterium]
MRSETAVLVTGASTGIGYATAVALAKNGYVVYAGCRTAQDDRRLRDAHEKIRPLLLDVTQQQQISAAAEAIAEGGAPLYAVTNNAGIAVAGPLEYIPLDDFRRQFEVNVLGALAVTQAMLPLLRRTSGRIVFVSSVSGQIAPPYIGPYAASKFALEAMADSLRMELSSFGIAVSVIQPGNVKTPIWAKGRAEKDALVARLPAKAVEHYGEAIEKLVRVTEREERTGISPEIVAETVVRALNSARPRARYPIGTPSGWMRKFASLLPESHRDRLIMKNFEN